jgi:hypothetical protein
VKEEREERQEGGGEWEERVRPQARALTSKS